MACQGSPEIPFDSVYRDGNEDKEQAQQETYYTEQESLGSLAKSVEDAVEGACYVHERADKAERQDKASGKLRVEKQPSCGASGD